MTKIKVVIGFAAFLFLVIGGELFLIRVFDVDARILESLVFIIPIAVAICIVLMIWNPFRKKAGRRPRRRKQNVQ